MTSSRSFTAPARIACGEQLLGGAVVDDVRLRGGVGTVNSLLVPTCRSRQHRGPRWLLPPPEHANTRPGALRRGPGPARAASVRLSSWRPRAPCPSASRTPPAIMNPWSTPGRSAEDDWSRAGPARRNATLTRAALAGSGRRLVGGTGETTSMTRSVVRLAELQQRPLAARLRRLDQPDDFAACRLDRGGCAGARRPRRVAGDETAHGANAARTITPTRAPGAPGSAQTASTCTRGRSRRHVALPITTSAISRRFSRVACAAIRPGVLLVPCRAAGSAGRAKVSGRRH